MIILWLYPSQRKCQQLSCAAQLHCHEAGTLFKDMDLVYLQFTDRYYAGKPLAQMVQCDMFINKEVVPFLVLTHL